MPRLGTDDEMETHKIGGGNFSFTGARIQNLGATEYTLASIVVDTTGSLSGHETELQDMLKVAAHSCQKSPRSDNLLLRVVLFDSSAGIREMHGFKPLNEIDIDTAYANLHCGGLTPLYDAAYSAIGAVNVYGEQLNKQDFLTNAVTFIITDGEDNTSNATPKMIFDEVRKGVVGEALESHVTILIGLTSSGYSKDALKRLKDDAELTQFLDAGDVTKGKLAKLAAFVSSSVSSTSQALGTGGPSQQIAATI